MVKVSFASHLLPLHTQQVSQGQGSRIHFRKFQVTLKRTQMGLHCHHSFQKQRNRKVVSFAYTFIFTLYFVKIIKYSRFLNILKFVKLKETILFLIFDAKIKMVIFLISRRKITTKNILGQRRNSYVLPLYIQYVLSDHLVKFLLTRFEHSPHVSIRIWTGQQQLQLQK